MSDDQPTDEAQEPEEIGCCGHRQIDLNKVIEDHLTEKGATVITVGTMICGDFGDRFRQLLKHVDPDSYAHYRELKYPDGPDSVTPESALAAMTYVFERASELLLPHYLSHAVFEKQTA